MCINYILIIWIHFIADFILQSDKIAINKSKNIKYLFYHCFVYSIPMLLFGWKFAIINGVAHFLVDFITSKITFYLWNINQRHWFFTTIGLDQAIHITCLFITLKYLQ